MQPSAVLGKQARKQESKQGAQHLQRSGVARSHCWKSGAFPARLARKRTGGCRFQPGSCGCRMRNKRHVLPAMEFRGSEKKKRDETRQLCHSFFQKDGSCLDTERGTASLNSDNANTEGPRQLSRVRIPSVRFRPILCKDICEED